MGDIFIADDVAVNIITFMSNQVVITRYQHGKQADNYTRNVGLWVWLWPRMTVNL